MHPQPGTNLGSLLELGDGSSVTAFTTGESPFTEVKDRIHWTRQHVWKYNVVILAVLLAIWLVRVLQKWRRRRRSLYSTTEEDKTSDSASDSSSTLTGTVTPPDVKRNHAIEHESTPLLSHQHARPILSFWKRLFCKIQASLIYQPQPIPIINRSLPDNGTTIFISTFLGANIALGLINIPFRSTMLMVFGDRAANLFSANLPLLYLLAAKNQPLKHITGFSYEALNIFHRKLGELLCAFAAFHVATTITLYYQLLHPLLPHLTLWGFICEPIILMGALAFVCYETLFLTSLDSFRQRWYELFLASHVLLQMGALGFLFFHYPISKLYVLIAVTIFCVDRLVYRFATNTTTMQASLDILEDGQTVMLSADWAIVGKRPRLFGKHSIKHGWNPCHHVFISIPALSKTAVLQAHPFTIASGAPDLTVEKPYAWLNLLIRAHDGFTRDLLKYAQADSKVSVRFDGPYGSLEPLHMLKATEHAVLVAGGSGIAVVFPLIWGLLHEPEQDSSTMRDDEGSGGVLKPKTRSRRKVTLIWIIHSASHRSWMPEDRLDELTGLGLDVRIPPPTATHGRPDVGAMVSELVYSTKAESTGVIVSGPDALNRDTRNTCSRLVGDGLDVSVTVEKFGW